MSANSQLLKTCQQLIANNDLAQAQSKCEKFLDQFPSNPQALTLYADILSRQENKDGALSCYLQLLDQDDSNLDYLINTAILATKARKLHQAISVFSLLFYTLLKQQNSPITTPKPQLDLAEINLFCQLLDEFVNSGLFFSISIEIQRYIIQCCYRLITQLRSNEFSKAINAFTQLLNHFSKHNYPSDIICRVYNLLRFLYWGTHQSLDPIEQYSNYVVKPMADYAIKHFETTDFNFPRRKLSSGSKINVLFLVFDLNIRLGYAISPIIYSQLLGHHQLNSPDINITIYSLQAINPETLEKYNKLGFVIKDFSSIDSTDKKIKAIFQAAEHDQIDIAVTETNLAEQTLLYRLRLAPIQFYWGTGFFHWNMENVDYLVIPSRFKRLPAYTATSGDTERVVYQTQPRDKQFLTKTFSQAELSIVKNQYPQGKKVIGNYGRLIKITAEFLAMLKIILENNNDTIAIIAGTNDPSLIENFIVKNKLEEQLFLDNHLVEGQLYLELFDVYIDTFPLYSGSSCLEAMAHQVPVVHMTVPEEGGKAAIDGWRDVELAADNTEHYAQIVSRLLKDPSFYRSACERCIDVMAPMMDVKKSAEQFENLWRGQALTPNF